MVVPAHGNAIRETSSADRDQAPRGVRGIAIPAVAAEVLLGSGVLFAWIVAIYLGLLFFRRLASADSYQGSREVQRQTERPHRTSRAQRRRGFRPATS